MADSDSAVSILAASAAAVEALAVEDIIAEHELETHREALVMSCIRTDPVVRRGGTNSYLDRRESRSPP
jgi:hypothetical protein